MPTLLVLSFQAQALGLGNLDVRSHLDEPFKGEVELQSLHDQPLKSIRVQLASRSDFQSAGIQRLAQLSSLRFAVRQMASGKPVIQITTLNGVSEPYLHFLISVEWSGGRILREYTALLDPPTYAATLPAAVNIAQQEDSTTTAVKISGAAVNNTGRQQKIPVKQVKLTSTGISSSVVAESGHTVKKGETAWQIVSSMERPRDVNIYQLLQMLHQANPDAFINNNINLLKTGSHLNLPDAKSAHAISKKEASRLYRLQLDLWQAYQEYTNSGVTSSNKVTESSGSQAAVVAKANKAAETESATGSKQQPLVAITPSSENKNPTSSEKETSDLKTAGDVKQDLLKIVQTTASKSSSKVLAEGNNDAAPGTASTGNQPDQIKRLRSKVSAMQESLLSRDLENKDLRERVALLEQQIQNATRLIEIRNQQLARIQGKQSPADTLTSEQITDSTASKSANTKSVDKIDSSQNIATTAVQSDKTQHQTTESTANKGTNKLTKSKQQPARAIKTQHPPPPIKSWWQEIYESVLASQTRMLGVGGGVVLLGGILIVLLRRRRVGEVVADRDSSQSHSYDANEVDGKPKDGDSDSSFMSDFGLSGMGMMQAAEVDPLAEADVYMAYGRDEQAEEVLREAMSRDPSRSEIKMKLLDIYEQRGDISSFETLAQELSPLQSGYDQNIWSRVVEMGQHLDPDNTLYNQPVDMASGIDHDTAAQQAASEQVAEGTETNKNTTFTADDFDNPFSDVDSELGAVEFKAPDTDKLSSLMEPGDETDSGLLGTTALPGIDLPDLDLDSPGFSAAVEAIPSDESEQATQIETVSDDGSRVDTLPDFNFVEFDDPAVTDDIGETDIRPTGEEFPVFAADELVEDTSTGNTLDFDFSGLDSDSTDEVNQLPSDENVLDAAMLEVEQNADGDQDLASFEFDLTDSAVDRETDSAFVIEGDVQPEQEQSTGQDQENLDFSDHDLSSKDELAAVTTPYNETEENGVTNDESGLQQEELDLPNITTVTDSPLKASADAGEFAPAPEQEGHGQEDYPGQVGGKESMAEMTGPAANERPPLEDEPWSSVAPDSSSQPQTADETLIYPRSEPEVPIASEDIAATPQTTYPPSTPEVTEEVSDDKDIFENEMDTLDEIIARDVDNADEDDRSLDESDLLDSNNRDNVGEDEIATKLDLARAYIDMGDAKGGREILDEVLDEGNPAQQSLARDLIGELDSDS